METAFVHRLVDHALLQCQVPEKDRQAHASHLFRSGFNGSRLALDYELLLTRKGSSHLLMHHLLVNSHLCVLAS